MGIFVSYRFEGNSQDEAETYSRYHCSKTYDDPPYPTGRLFCPNEEIVPVALSSLNSKLPSSSCYPVFIQKGSSSLDDPSQMLERQKFDYFRVDRIR